MKKLIMLKNVLKINFKIHELESNEDDEIESKIRRIDKRFDETMTLGLYLDHFLF